MISIYVYWNILMMTETIYYQWIISEYLIRMVQILSHLQFHHFIVFLSMDVNVHNKSVVYSSILYSMQMKDFHYIYISLLHIIIIQFIIVFTFLVYSIIYRHGTSSNIFSWKFYYNSRGFMCAYLWIFYGN